MILIDKQKFSIDGLDVYPDHENPKQFWYVPGSIRLTERDNRKVLSYFWYTDSNSDQDGTGFLNFEVNAGITDATRDKILALIASRTKLGVGDIDLAPVPYTTGRVNFSVLGPIAAKAAQRDLEKDPAVTYSSKEQVVWQAGSSSLVGDNAAVCAVKFTKEGKLAGAMYQAILENANLISAVYRLDFLAMRPAVTFRVTGTLNKTIDALQASLGAEIPLGKLILDVGLQATWERIISKTDLKIELINYGGEETEGLKWARQIVLEHVLENFFQVQLGGSDKWLPIADDKETKDTIDEAKDLEFDATEKATEGGDGDGDGDGDEGGDEGGDGDEGGEGDGDGGGEGDGDGKGDGGEDGKGTDGGTTDDGKKDDGKKDGKKGGQGGGSGGTKGNKNPETVGGAVKDVLKSAMKAIPRVKIRVSYYRGEQVNTIDFLYNEMKARPYRIAPQALVLTGLVDPEKNYTTKVNRAAVPFGLPYRIAVSIPNEEDRAKIGLQTVNVQARYPADAPQGKQASFNLTSTGTGVEGPNPFPFQYDSSGSPAMTYSVDYVFKASDDWNTNQYQFNDKGRTDKGFLTAMPETILDFLTIDIRLGTDFAWDEADQVVVILTSKRWAGEKRVVFSKGKADAQEFRSRCEIALAREPVDYKVELRRRNKAFYSYGPEPMEDKQITVHDRFAEHIPIVFKASFKGDVESATITLTFVDGDFEWEDEFLLEKEPKQIQRSIPMVNKLKKKSDLKFRIQVNPDEGEPYEKEIKGAAPVVVKAE